MDDFDFDALHSMMDEIEARSCSNASSEPAAPMEAEFKDAELDLLTELAEREYQEQEFLIECVRLTVAAEESLAHGLTTAAPRPPAPRAAARKRASSRCPAPASGFSARDALRDRVSLKSHSAVSAVSCSLARTVERQASARKSAVRRSRRNSDAFDPIEQ